MDARALLTEIAQWYGILVPTEPGYWQFAHRTIHDFLAARFMVENSKFNPRTIHDWGTREAYAACLLGDATESLVCALRVQRTTDAFTECLYNNALFDPHQVAKAVIEHFEANRSSFE